MLLGGNIKRGQEKRAKPKRKIKKKGKLTEKKDKYQRKGARGEDIRISLEGEKLFSHKGKRGGGG